MADRQMPPDELYDIGKLYYERSDFKTALTKFAEASGKFFAEENYKGYLKTLTLMLRIYVELERYDLIDDTKEALQDLVLKEKVSLESRTYYTLGLCAAYKNQYKTALEYLEKALALALTNDDKEDTCYAINGLAIVYKCLGRYEEALKEIYNLQVFFQVLPIPDVELSSSILNGNILRALGKYEQALDVYWQSYESLKSNKNLFMYVYLLKEMGVTYKEMGDHGMARMYLTLAKRSADPDNLMRLIRIIDEHLEDLGGYDESKYDLVFRAAAKSVHEKKKGKVDFKNQFILMDMLKLFIKHPGEVYSKEELVQKVWRQEYDPRVHDNKIYVTIKRLRKLIEPDFEKPKYIFRAKNGYYLNKDIKVRIEH